MHDNLTSATCSECSGDTVQFRGSGLSMQYRICSRYKEPGHISEEEIKTRIAERRCAVRPGGRFA